MKTFNEWYWLAPAAALATQAMRVSPQSLAQLPSQTYDKVKSGINKVKKISLNVKKKFKNEKPKGIKTNKITTAEEASVTVSAIGGDNYERTRDMGPKKRKKKSPGFSDNQKIDGRKMKNLSYGISPFRKMYNM